MFMILTVFVKPSSRKNNLEWLDKDTVKISVIEQPKKEKANKAVILALSKELNIAKSQIEIIRGSTSKIKHIRIIKTP